MKLKGEFKFVGSEKGVSREGKTYYVLSVLQGLDSSRIYVNEETFRNVQGFEPFSDVGCELTINMTQKGTFVNCDDIYQLPKDVALASKKEK